MRLKKSFSVITGTPELMCIDQCGVVNVAVNEIFILYIHFIFFILPGLAGMLLVSLLWKRKRVGAVACDTTRRSRKAYTPKPADSILPLR